MKGTGARARESMLLKIDNFCYSRQRKGKVVREALRLLEEYDSARGAQLAEFNGEPGHRLASLDRGEGVSPSEARARLQRKSEERRKRRS